MNDQSFLIKTMAGLEPVLAEELRRLGAAGIEPLNRAVRCTGDRRLLYRANLWLRTALRILLPIASFKVRHDDELYRRVKKIDWSQYLGLDDTFAVDAVTHSEVLPHSKFAALRTKDAIVDQFRERTGRRPSIDVENPGLRLNLHVSEQNATLSLDSSGDSLHKRGYRTEGLAAPLNEVLAAGLILLSGWNGRRPFVDPMCGSGALPIEAAMLAYNIPPQLYRPSFGFFRWRDFDPALWREVVQEARDNIKKEGPPIFGYDQDRRAVNSARRNALAARVEDKITFERERFENLAPPAADGFLLMNPPYNERLGHPDIVAFYQNIGDRLKQAWTGYEAWIISGNKTALKRLGLRASNKHQLLNGAIECKFHQYELYQGSKAKEKS